MAEPSIDRRRFLQLGAGAVAVVGLGSCDPRQETTSPGCEAPNTTASTDRRRLVVVQLNGGNDLLNTLPPSDGRYRDARPSIAVDEDGLVALGGGSEGAPHPRPAPPAPRWGAGELAVLPGLGSSQPHRRPFYTPGAAARAPSVDLGGGRVINKKKKKTYRLRQIHFRETVRGSWELPIKIWLYCCLLYTSPSPRDRTRYRMPSSA